MLFFFKHVKKKLESWKFDCFFFRESNGIQISRNLRINFFRRKRVALFSRKIIKIKVRHEVMPVLWSGGSHYEN